MTDAVQVALIAAVPGILGVIVGLHNKSSIREIHLSLNSRLDQLILASKDSGRIAERTRSADAVEKSQAEGSLRQNEAKP
jgi:hypothetical protein